MSIQSIGLRSVFVTRTSRPATWIVAISLITLYHAAAMPNASATTIDNFQNAGPSNPGDAYYIASNPTTNTMTQYGNPVVTSNTHTLNITDNVSTSVAIGGVRNTTINVIGTLTLDSVRGVIGHDGRLGLDALQVNTNGPVQATVTSTYLQGGTSPAIDLTSGGTQSGIDLKVLSTDQPLGITVTLSNTLTGNSWSSSATAPTNANTAPEDVILPFSSFLGPASPGAGTSINLITIVYNGGASPLADIDFAIGAINTTNTPEPASAALFVIGCVAICGAGYRQSRRRSAMSANSRCV
jgi:hypothetical protein